MYKDIGESGSEWNELNIIKWQRSWNKEWNKCHFIVTLKFTNRLK